MAIELSDNDKRLAEIDADSFIACVLGDVSEISAEIDYSQTRQQICKDTAAYWEAEYEKVYEKRLRREIQNGE